MRYLLDTNACIVFLSGRSPSLEKKLKSVSSREIAVCSVVRFELLYGAAKSSDPARTRLTQEEFLSRFASFDFDDGAAEAAARIRADLEAGGEPIGPLDLQIAAIAVSNNLTLVSHNVRHFRRISGLQIEDWEADA